MVPARSFRLESRAPATIDSEAVPVEPIAKLRRLAGNHVARLANAYANITLLNENRLVAAVAFEVQVDRLVVLQPRRAAPDAAHAVAHAHALAVDAEERTIVPPLREHDRDAKQATDRNGLWDEQLANAAVVVTHGDGDGASELAHRNRQDDHQNDQPAPKGLAFATVDYELFRHMTTVTPSEGVLARALRASGTPAARLRLTTATRRAVALHVVAVLARATLLAGATRLVGAALLARSPLL